MGTIILIVLVILLLGGGGFGYSRYGYGGGIGIGGLLLLVLWGWNTTGSRHGTGLSQTTAVGPLERFDSGSANDRCRRVLTVGPSIHEGPLATQ
jgi:hypothetical protein